MRVPRAASAAAARSGNGGQITISQYSAPATSGRNASKNIRVSGRVLYIFQLPAITGFLIGWVPRRDTLPASTFPRVADRMARRRKYTLGEHPVFLWMPES